MSETFHSHLGKLLANTKDLLTRPAAEQTLKHKESAPSSPQSTSGTPQGKGDPHALLAEEKRRRRRIPFVALALVLLFTSLCTIGLLGLHSPALAHSGLVLDATATAASSPPQPEAAPLNQTTSYLKSQGKYSLADSGTCDHFQSDLLSKGAGSPPAPFCWNSKDFDWATRDITCIVNDAHNPGVAVNSYTLGDGHIVTGPAPTTGNMFAADPPTTSLSATVPNLASTPRNQNTCTNHSTCYSDDASHNDASNGGQIHAEVGGDNIICSNDNCTSAPPGTTDDCGDTSGGGLQLEYDKFACRMIDSSVRYGSANGNIDYNFPGSNASYMWNEDWDSTGIAINPTAYDPNGAIYLPTTVYSPDDTRIQPSRDRPKCDATAHWECSTQDGTQDNVVVNVWYGNFAEGSINDSDNTPHLKKEVVPGNFGPLPIFVVACNTSGGGWAFPCSDVSADSGPYGGNVPFISPETNTQSLDHGQVNEGMISKDWLSGDYDPKAEVHNVAPSSTSPSAGAAPGHLEYTYRTDTVELDGIANKLFPLMLGVGYIFIAPVLMSMGYQLLWSSWTLVNVSLMEAFGRIILSVVAVGSSYFLASMLIDVTNVFNTAIIGLHAKLGYPDFNIGSQAYSFTLVPQGETTALNPRAAESFRGVVVPISRWGCVANDFIALIANKFWTDAAGFIPVVGGIAKFAGGIANAVDLAHHIGEFVVLILSITLCTQVMVRIIMLNYYILMGPVVFACWGLPWWGAGQKVVRSWAKGLFSLLLTQTIQLFVLTTLPLILPTFPSLPTDQFGIINTIMAAIPRMLLLTATIQVPKYMGTKATVAVAQAGTVMGGVVAAGGAAALHAV